MVDRSATCCPEGGRARPWRDECLEPNHEAPSLLWNVVPVPLSIVTNRFAFLSIGTMRDLAPAETRITRVLPIANSSVQLARLSLEDCVYRGSNGPLCCQHQRAVVRARLCTLCSHGANHAAPPICISSKGLSLIGKRGHSGRTII